MANEGADDQDPKVETLQDLWRHISGMEGRLRGEIQGVETRLTTKMDAGFAEVKGDIQELKGETQAIRETLDTLPSEGDFQELDRKVAVVANDTKATRADARNLKAEVSRLRADVKSAGIPVR